MEFQQVLQRRASCRRFRPDPVSTDDLEQIVSAATLAPSPANAQPWRFVAVTNRPLLEEMARVVRRRSIETFPTPRHDRGERAMERVLWNSTFFAEAPAVIFVALSPYRSVIDEAVEGHARPSHEEINERRMRPDLQCIGAVVEHLLLAATDRGLGSCWLSAPLVARPELESMIGISPPWQLASLVALGRPEILSRVEKDRKPLEQVFELIP